MPADVGEIAAALRHDPVLLGSMLGNGATSEVDAALHARLDGLTVPVFVVLTRTPPGYGGSEVDSELVALVHARLGRDGIYYVRTSAGHGSVAVYGDVDPKADDDATLVSLAQYTARDQVEHAVERVDPDLEVPAVTEAAVLLDVAAQISAHHAVPDYERPVLSPAQVAGYTARPWVAVGYVDHDDRPQPLGVGDAAVVGVSVALVTTVLTFRGLQALAVARRSGTEGRRRRAADLTRARQDARRALAQLDRRLEPGGVAGDRDLATGCSEVAHDLLASDDLLDLVGAAVLARTGARALERHGADRPYRCCFLDPRHGEAEHEADLGSGLSVPVCRRCRSGLDAGREPAALREGRRPYYEGDSVWARTGFGTLSDTLWLDVRRAARR